MNITGISMLMIFVAAVAIGVSVQRIGRDAMSIRSGIFWILLWFSIAAVALFPDVLNGILALSNMQNRVLFALLIAVLIIFAMLFAQTSRIQSLERDISHLTRQAALQQFQLNGSLNGKKAISDPAQHDEQTEKSR